MPRDDRRSEEDRLLDMARACRDVLEALGDRDLAAFRQSRIIQAAVERGLMIIGEAAWHVSDDFQAAHPEIEWRTLVGLRHVIVHGDLEISTERLHGIATSDVPRLLDALEPLLPLRPPDDERND